MLKVSLLLLFFSSAVIGLSQNVVSTKQVSPQKEYENSYVEKIAGDSLSTNFMIWIKDTVNTHKHERHSETVYILEGAGTIYFNDSITKQLTKGSVVFIPKNTWHAVKVTSATPMQVLSIQSPGFYGEDRVFKTLKK